MKTVVLGIALDLGAENLGVADGPKAFRECKIIDKLNSAGLNVTDRGDIGAVDRSGLNPGTQSLRYLDEIIRVSELSAGIVDDLIGEGVKVIAIGGDHSINLGVVSGASSALNGDVGVIYLDAHGDMNTNETTMSGNIHGMHLASLMGYGAPELAHVYGDQIKLNKDNLLHIGGSDFDKPELELVKSEDIKTFMLNDLLMHGMAPLMGMIDELSQKVSNIWVSLDLDVIDMIYAPGAGMPNKRGLTYREIAAIAEYIGSHCNVVGIDVVEYNPLQDIDHKTAELGIELIAKFLGHDYSWYASYYMAHNRLER